MGERTISKSPVRPLDADALAAAVVASLDRDKAEEVVVIDLRGRASFCDRLVIATGRSTRQVGAMADHLVERLKEAGVAVTLEGKTQADWVLIDAGDVIVHLFRPDIRAFYDLEGMWGDRAATRKSRAARA